MVQLAAKVGTNPNATTVSHQVDASEVHEGDPFAVASGAAVAECRPQLQKALLVAAVEADAPAAPPNTTASARRLPHNHHFLCPVHSHSRRHRYRHRCRRARRR